MARDDTLTMTEADKKAARAGYIGKKFGIKTPDGQL